MKDILKTFLLTIALLGSLACEPEDRIWMVYEETQCSDPWGFNSNDTGSKVKDYLKERGIKVFDVEVVRYSIGPFCAACSCPSGRNIRVEVRDSDREALIGLGFNS